MTSNTANTGPVGCRDNNVVLQGYHKKLKTMKKKYFVLCAEDEHSSARLEYYDSEKKFKSRSNPKRTIILKNCFNINRRLDTKYKFVIALSIKEEGFCIVLETEQELNTWLKSLLALQRGEDTESDSPKPNFEHVWQVQVQRKGLAEERGIIGKYHVCLTSKSLTLVRIGSPKTTSDEDRLFSVEFYLTTIRRCGDSQCFFYMEVGRHSAIGAGELWMQTAAPLIAQNMHNMIIHAMSSTKNMEDGFGPMRKRSSSANEASKPISVIQRRQTHSGTKLMNSSPLSALSASSCCSTTRVTPVITSTSCNPQYPFTAPMRTLGSQRRHSVSAMSSVCHQRTLSLPNGDPILAMNNQTFSGNSNNNCNANSTKLLNNITSHIIATNTNGDNTIHTNIIQPVHQRTRSLPLTEETAIQINQLNTQPSFKQNYNNAYNGGSNTCSCNLSAKVHYNCSTRVCKGSSSSSFFNLSSNNNHIGSNNLNIKKKLNCFGGCGDIHEMNNNNNNGSSIIGTNSMESITEDPNMIVGDDDNNHSDIKNIQNFIVKNSNGKYPKGSITNQNNMKSSTGGSPSLLRRGRNVRSSRSTTLGRERCDSLPSRNRTASECSNPSITMPPPKSIPMQSRPHSMYCNNRLSNSPPMSTLSPSTGCSESDGSSLSIDEPDSFGHSLTPDESGNFVVRYYNNRIIPEEQIFWDNENKRHITMDHHLNNHHGGLSLPISTNHNATRKGSPASHIGSGDLQSQYMDMFSPHSPYGSSPCDPPLGFIPVSSEYHRGLYTGSSGGHSRASSLAEETIDVPMCSRSTDYVDMEITPKQPHLSEMSSAASSSSITSGTPSTDLRFAEYPLDKVKTRFAPDDEDLHTSNERPIRAYSVGSRPEHNKRKFRLDILNTEQNNSRARACSVGSRAKVPRSDLYRGVFNPSQICCHTNNNNVVEAMTSVIKSKKSCSAPILVHKSQSSVDRMSDLMEIDFSKNIEQYEQQRNSHSKPSPVRISSFPVSVPITRQKHDFFENSPKLSRFEMKPSSFTDKSSPSMRHTSSDSGYLEMRPIGATKNCSLSSSPIKFNSAPKQIVRNNDENNYMNMSPSTSSTSSIHHRRVNSDDYLNMSPRDKIIPSYKKMDVDSFVSNSSTPEGYIEMSFKKPSRTDNNDANTPIDPFRPNGEIKMINRDTRNVSSPIDIKSIMDSKRSPPMLSEAFMKMQRLNDPIESDIVTSTASHTNTIFPFSPCSPVIQYVQNDFAQRKCLVDATSGTITLSDDYSNINPVINQNASTSKLLNIDTSKILNTDVFSEKNAQGNVEALSNDYADMSLGSTKLKNTPEKNVIIKECSDYVNYVPTLPDELLIKPVTVFPVNTSNDDKNYAIMKNMSTHKAESSSNNSNISTPSPCINSNKFCLLKVDKCEIRHFEGFKPIDSSADEILFKGSIANARRISSSKSGQIHLNRQLSDKCKNDDRSSGYELLQMRSDSSLQTKKILSRPNSVNSEKISPSKYLNRPNSANSECMPSISTSSSTSTLCGSSSSSSTLCGSKSQSPLANSRPQSFSDTTVASRPESVSSITDQIITSRPPSVSSERGLHYASLDLPPSNISNNNNNATTTATTTMDTTSTTTGTTNITSSCSSSGGTTPSLIKCGNSSASGESSSPSPNASGCQQQPTFIYAQIDFNKSESLKMAINAGNNQ